MAIKLSELEQAFKKTFHLATPHHDPDFTTIRQLTGEKDPEVHMAIIFIVVDNTGYDGVLERYLCNAGKQRIAFHVDLLPGFVVSGVTLREEP